MSVHSQTKRISVPQLMQYKGQQKIAAGDELERARGDFLARFGNSDDDARTPAAMAGFERLAHYGRVAGAVESIVSAAVGQGHQMRNDIVGDLLRVNEMGHAELAPPFFRSEEHTSELQSLMRISYAVFCL